MRLPKWSSRPSEHASATLESVLMACTVVMLLASLGGLAALITSLHVGLRVGDILVFKPQTTLASALSVTAERAGPRFSQAAATATCTLDPATMAHDGGSLVVEAKSLVAPTYDVHWAGGRTATDGTNCGRTADLTMSRMDLQSLVNAIGGFSFDARGNLL